MWSIEAGDTLGTMAMVEAGPDRELVRYPAASIPDSVDVAHDDLSRRLRTGGWAVLVMDGYANPDRANQTEAVIAEMLGTGARSLGTIIQPYRAARRSRIPFIGHASDFVVLGGLLLSEDIETEDAEKHVLEGIREQPTGFALFEAAEQFDARRY
jgi:hypothetical protein